MKRAFRVHRGLSGTGMRLIPYEVPLQIRLEQRRKSKMTTEKTCDGYHPDNLKLQPFHHEAVIELARRARELGVQFKINGIPFGAPYNKELWDAFQPRTGDGNVHTPAS